jgi:TP901 family phage tail tape measure protein
VNLSDLVIVVRASTRDFTAGMAKTRAEIAKTQTTAQRLNNIGGASMAVGKKLTKGITLPVVAIGAASVVMAARFEGDMTLIQTQAGGTAADVEELSTAILKMSHTAGVQHGPEELARGLYHLKSVGMDNTQAMAALTASEHLASVGHADLEASTNAVAGAWKSGIKGAEDFNSAAAVVNATIGAGNLRMEDLVSAMGTGVLVNAQQAGASFQDVGAALATMTSRGIPAVRAATAIKMAFAGIVNPSGTATKAMDKIGLKQLDLAKAMQTGGLPAAMELLNSKLKGLDKVHKTQILGQMFGAKSSQAILTLIGNMEDYRRVQKQVADNATDAKFKEAIAAQAQDASAMWAHLKTTLGGSLIEFGNILLPTVVKVGDAIGKVAEWMGKLSPEGKKTVAIIALIAAAAGPLLFVFGSMAKSVGSIINVFSAFGPAASKAAGGARLLNVAFLTSPVFLVIAGIAALVITFVILWKKCEWFRNFWKGLWRHIVDIAKSVWTAIRPSVMKVWQALKDAWDKVWTTTKQVWAYIKPYVVTVLKALWAAVKVYFKVIVEVVKVAWKLLVIHAKVAWKALTIYIRVVVAVIKGIITGIRVAVFVVRGVWHAIVTVTRAVWNVVAGVVRRYVHAIVVVARIVHRVYTAVARAWGLVRGVTRRVWNGLKGIIGGVIDWIWEKIEAVWDRIEGVYNRVKGWLGGGNTGARVGKGGRLARHAEGAWIPATTGGTPFLGGEGGEGEWVVPASKAQDFASAVKGGSGGGVTVTINIANVNGTDRQAADRLARMASERLMAGVLRQMVGQNV